MKERNAWEGPADSALLLFCNKLDVPVRARHRAGRFLACQARLCGYESVRSEVPKPEAAVVCLLCRTSPTTCGSSA